MSATSLCRMFYRTARLSPIQSRLNITSYLTKFPAYSSQPTIDSLKLSQETCLDVVEEKKLADEVVELVNKQVEQNEQGRLFAIVHISGKQFRVTPNDIIIVDNDTFGPHNGDKIKFEKVLLVGGSDFTLIGRPLLTPGLVDVIGTIIEKDLSHTRTNFRKIPRKSSMRFRFLRTQLTMVRINKIEIKEKVGQRKDVEGAEKLIS